MRIMIHSNAPWVPSGYGKQTLLLMHGLRGLGHEVVVSAFSGLAGAVMEYEGVTCLPAGQMGYGLDMIIPHAVHTRADLVITLMDFWQLAPIAEQLRQLNVAAWLPVDCTPLSKLDRQMILRSGARPIAMAPFGAEQLRGAGFEPLFAPHAHAISDGQYEKAQETRQAYRAAMGIDDRFVIGMCAANNDWTRKGFPEQFEAFRRFHEKVPEALLLVHTQGRTGQGLDLHELMRDMQMPADSVRLSDSYAQLSGSFDEEMMRDWFSVLDVLSSCSFAEAFGVPMLEAQACGTPVVSTHGSAMRDVNQEGWEVVSEPFWNPVHGAWWRRPSIASITRAYVKAHQDAGRRRARVRDFAVDYHIDRVMENHWKPLLEELEMKPCG